jgi:MOB kinase activator 1
LRQHIDATLGSGNLREAVLLPPGEDLNEWLAVNTVDFYNAISVLYGTLAEYCVDASCPAMCAGPKYEYRWADGVVIKKPIKCSAPKYVDYLFEWVEKQVDDPRLFPQRSGNSDGEGESTFPEGFQDAVKKIFTRLFRVYAHIYHSHFAKVVQLGAEAHLNTLFKHFVFFTNAFSLVKREELAPLGELVDGILGVAQRPAERAARNDEGPGVGGGSVCRLFFFSSSTSCHSQSPRDDRTVGETPNHDCRSIADPRTGGRAASRGPDASRSALSRFAGPVLNARRAGFGRRAARVARRDGAGQGERRQETVVGSGRVGARRLARRGREGTGASRGVPQVLRDLHQEGRPGAGDEGAR